MPRGAHESPRVETEWRPSEDIGLHGYGTWMYLNKYVHSPLFIYKQIYREHCSAI